MCSSKLLIWHIVYFGWLIILLRIIAIFLAVMLLGWSVVKFHIQFIKYTLNPLGKRMIYTSTPPNIKPYELISVVVQMVPIFIIYLITNVIQNVSLALTCGIKTEFYEYNESMLSVFNMNKQIEIISEKDYQSTENPITESNYKSKTETTAVPTYQTVTTSVPSAPPKYEDVAVSIPAVDVQIEHPSNRNTDEIKLWLKSIDETYYTNYFHVFVQNGFDSMELIKTLSDQDLKEIGVDKMGHRRKIKIEIDNYQYEVEGQNSNENITNC
eukprot:429839_1